MKPLVTIVLVIIAVFGLFKILSPNRSPTQQTSTENPDLILYWGDGCSHCENLKKYITENKIEQKLKITYKEVWSNESNLNELKETIKLCPEIDPSKGIGVPLVFFTSDKKCTVGDTPTIDKIVQMVK